MDALKKIAFKGIEIVLGSGLAIALPVAATTAPRLALALGESINSALLARYGEKIVQHAPRVKDIVEGALIDGPPAMTGAGAASSIIKFVYDESKKKEITVLVG